MSQRVDVYYSLQSDYCYFLLDRLLWLDQCAEVAIRPVLPGLIRNPHLFADRGETEMAYFQTDTARLAEMLGLPYRYPDPSPVEFQSGSLWVPAKEQPRIKGLYHLFTAACLDGQGLAFLDQVMRLIWDGRGVDWTDPGMMDVALAGAGLDRANLEAVPAERVAAALDDNDKAMKAAGHWGVPLMVYEGEPFYGQDRFDHLLWRMGISQ